MLGVFANEEDKVAMENPDKAESLNFYDDKLTETPEILRGLKNLKKLNLEKNNITSLDSNIILTLENLEEINEE